VGIDPRAVAVDPVTDKIYVADELSAEVTAIDGATNTTTSIPAGTYPWAVAVNPVTDRIYVANFGSSDVTVIDGATNATTLVAAGASPSAVAVNPVTNKVYVADSNGVTVIDGTTDSTTLVAAGAGPSAVAVNPVTDRIYAANGQSDNVTVISDAPANDTKVRAVFALPPGDTTALARPTLTGKAVNRASPQRNVMMGVCDRANTAQLAWNWATVTSGAGTDSIEWTYEWGADSLVWGENFVCAQPLESDAGITNNEGLGTPFAGNLEVYPVYRVLHYTGVTNERREANPGVLALSVFPNPCPGKASIMYSLSRSGNVSLKLYDVAGKLVATLATGYRKAGRYNMLLTPTLSSERRGSNLAQGVYLLRLKTEDGVKNQKLIIE
jgi:YVTN family beta-propeller protein